MTAEEKLFMHVVLQAIAEQDPQFADASEYPYSRQARAKERIAADAREYVGRIDCGCITNCDCGHAEGSHAHVCFVHACHAANIRPDFARSITPEQANQALTRLNDVNHARLETNESIEKEIQLLEAA